jgi:hypothetical protein
LEVADEDPTQVDPVVDLVVWQVLEPLARRVTEVERQVLDDEEVVGRSPGVARQPVVLESYIGVGVPVVSWHIGRSPEARGELHVADALAKSPWTPLVRRPAALVRIMCGSRTGGWSLPCVMSD